MGPRWASAWAVVVASGALLAGCSSGGRSTPPAPDTVVLRDIAFSPGTLVVDAGDTVTWRFEDRGISHDVVAEDQSFESEVRDTGTFRHTFPAPGTYRYKCTLHPAMKGTIKVR